MVLMRSALAALLSAALALAPLAPAPTLAAQPLPGTIGMNVAGCLNPYSDEIPFNDAMKESGNTDGAVWSFGQKYVNPVNTTVTGATVTSGLAVITVPSTAGIYVDPNQPPTLSDSAGAIAGTILSITSTQITVSAPATASATNDTLTINGPPAPTGSNAIDSNGWVSSMASNQVASTHMLAGSGTGQYPGGLYHIYYDGSGTFEFYGNNTIQSQSAGEIDLQVTPTSGSNAGIIMLITSTDPTNYVRNIRVIMPGYETTYTTNPWYTPFLNMFAPFSEVRYMPWEMVNTSRIANWSDRRQTTYATQAGNLACDGTNGAGGLGGSVSYEYMIDLANRLNLNPWVSVPFAASDDYVTQMATLFHNTLNPNLHPILEYVNEAWNNDTQQSACFYRNQAIALGLVASGSAAPCTTDSNGNYVAPSPNDLWTNATAQNNYYAYRLSQVIDIWNSVYGADSVKIVHTIGNFGGDTPGWINPELAYGQANYGLASKLDMIHTDAYIAPQYLAACTGGSTTNCWPAWSVVATWTPAQLEAAMTAYIDTQMTTRMAELNATGAAYGGLKIMIYEGGDGNVAPAGDPNEAAVAALFAATAVDPGMGGVYTHMLNVLKGAGVTLFNQFDDVGEPSDYGQWGALLYQDQPVTQSPKYQALVNWLSACH